MTRLFLTRDCGKTIRHRGTPPRRIVFKRAEPDAAERHPPRRFGDEDDAEGGPGAYPDTGTPDTVLRP